MDESAIKTFGLVASPEILNPEFKVGTLYPNTFESRKFCSVNDSLTIRIFFPLAFLYFSGIFFHLNIMWLSTSRRKYHTTKPLLIFSAFNKLRDHFRYLLRRR